MGDARSSTEQFRWRGDVSVGDWLADRLEGSHSQPTSEGPALAAIVPSGFDALVRVLHPFRRDRPAEVTWAEFWRWHHEGPSEGPPPTFDEQAITWADVAAAHDHALGHCPLSSELLGFTSDDEQPDGTQINSDGWRYDLPRQGSLDADVLAVVARVLAEHTKTPERGVTAVWEGYAGLVSGQGVGYCTFVTPNPSWPAPVNRLRQRWAQRTADFHGRRRSFGSRAALQAALFRLLRTPTWLQRLHTRRIARLSAETGHAEYAALPAWERLRQLPPGSGLLSKQAAKGPRLELPDRGYVCFDAGIRDFIEATWISRSPWIDSQDGIRDPQSPNLIWPEGREWVLVSEIDLDSTLIACSSDCAEALMAAPGIEAMLIERDSPLWQAPDR